MRIFLKFVSGYEGQQALFYESGDLSHYEVLEQDLSSITRSIKYSVDPLQSRLAVVNIGRMSLEFDAAGDGRWFFGSLFQYDRDHLIMIENTDGDVLWTGFCKKLTHTKKGTLRVDFNHVLDRLDDVYIDGDADENRVAVTVESIFEELRGKLSIWPAAADADVSTWPDVYRPGEDRKARDYIGAILISQRHVVIHDSTGNLALRESVAKTAPDDFDTATQWVIKDENVITMQTRDDKEKMFNTIKYTPHNGQETVYTGSLSQPYLYPAYYFFRYGARELDVNLEHLSAADALTSAQNIQTARIAPVRRCDIDVEIPDIAVEVLDTVKLELNHQSDIQLPYWGYFMIRALAIDLTKQTMKLTLEEIV